MSEVPIETRFVDARGLRFEVQTCGDPNAERLVLCLHGFPELAYSWRYQIPALAALGYRVWAPNQRGYGKSSRPRERAAYHVDELVADVAALVDAADARSVTLIGHDWGGAVAWLFALRAVRKLEGLVVMNLPHPTRFRQALKFGAQRRRSLYALFFQLPWLPERLLAARNGWAIGEAFRSMAVDKSRFPEEVLDVYRRHALEPGALTAMLNWYRAMRSDRNIEEDFPILDTRTLMIWGTQDTALGLETTWRTEELVRDFTIRYLPVSHWVQQEAPEAVNEILEAWLCGQPVPDPMPAGIDGAPEPGK
ncbi:MAG: alpha/beta hydrolase [Myxococcota bacterium]